MLVTCLSPVFPVNCYSLDPSSSRVRYISFRMSTEEYAWGNIQMSGLTKRFGIWKWWMTVDQTLSGHHISAISAWRIRRDSVFLPSIILLGEALSRFQKLDKLSPRSHGQTCRVSPYTLKWLRVTQNRQARTNRRAPNYTRVPYQKGGCLLLLALGAENMPPSYISARCSPSIICSENYRNKFATRLAWDPDPRQVGSGSTSSPI